MKKTIPICANCKYFEYKSGAVYIEDIERYSRCMRPRAQKVHVISGREYAAPKNLWCTMEREDGVIISFLEGSCGKRGRFYEPK